jgi:predicted glutamine amidotransferase
VVPAWSNANLHRLSEKIRSSCIFAHVRAATSGLLVSDVNCHPFQHGKLLWMHNGQIGPIDKIRRRMRDSLSDEHYDIILGTSDSEHSFAVFLEELGENKENPTMEEMEEALVATIKKILAWSREVDDNSPNYLNFAVTDGEKVLVSRFVSDEREEPPSLYVSYGSTFELHNGDFRMKRDDQGVQTALVSSEPLTNVEEDWIKVPRNHLLSISENNRVEMKPIVLT